MNVTIKRLREELPSWAWRAERYGFGWSYVGTLAWSEVRIRAYSVICGPAEDDCATQWRVEEGDHSEPFSRFWLRWRADRQEKQGPR